MVANFFWLTGVQYAAVQVDTSKDQYKHALQLLGSVDREVTKEMDFVKVGAVSARLTVGNWLYLSLVFVDFNGHESSLQASNPADAVRVR